MQPIVRPKVSARRPNSRRSAGWTHSLSAALFALASTQCVVSTYGGAGAPLDAPPTPKPISNPQPETAAGPTQPLVDTSEESIKASHLLVSYRGALRAAPNIVRSREEAFTRAQEALRRAQEGEPFEVLVKEYSDDLGSAARAGDLGEFTRQDMVAEFSEAAFKLKPGELSDIVESQFGFHVILRTE